MTRNMRLKLNSCPSENVFYAYEIPLQRYINFNSFHKLLCGRMIY
jgi:hypothetical protein